MTTTAQQIRESKPEGKMTMVSGNYGILFDNGVQFECENSREQRNLWNKLLKMGFERHYNFSSDETDGLVQAGLNGENPFAYSIICANTSLNGIFK